MNVYIMIEAVHERAIVGIWCDNCAKPSVIKVPILAISEEGVTECGTLESCAQCQEEDDGPTPLDGR